MSLRTTPKHRLLLGLAAVAVVVAATAVPGFAAPEKQFSLNVPPSVAAGDTGVSYPLTFKNETPGGNSSIKSLRADVTDGLTITNATAPSGSVSWTANRVEVTNISPVKPGDTFVLTLTVDVADATSCSSSVTWTPGAWAGTSFTSDTFRLLDDSLSQLVTQTSAGCQLRFVPGQTPANGILDEFVTAADGSYVQVELLQDGSPAEWFDGTVTIGATSAPSGAALSGNSVSASEGVATFSELSADAAGDYTVQASALGLTSDQASFTIFSDGIFCDGTTGGSGDGTTIDITRTDDGGGDCQDIPYTLTVTRNLITFLKDETLVRSQGAQFEITITWADAVGAYPDFGTTQFDIDGDGGIDPFIPDNCLVVGGIAQYPVNPNASGDYYPAPSTVEPWCVSAVDIHPEGDIMVATETFLGSGDPKIFR